MGLPEVLQDLIILTYAVQTNRIFKHHGGPANAELGTMLDEMTLEEVALPGQADWSVAQDRAKGLFGIPTSPLLNAANVTTLGEAVQRKVADLSGPLAALIGRLESIRVGTFGGMPCARLDTAREGLALLKTMEGLTGNALIGKLATYPLTGTAAVIASSMASATRLSQTLENADWVIFDGIRALDDERKEAAIKVWQELETAFASDEHAIALGPKIGELRDRAVKLLTRPAPTTKAPTPLPSALVTAEREPLPPAKTIEALKQLYGGSQIEGDDLPEWVRPDDVMDLLRVRCMGGDPGDWRSLIVVSPLYDALIRMDAGAKLNLAAGSLTLPRFGQSLKLTVKQQHLES